MEIETKIIDKVRFGIASPQELIDQATVQVISEETFTGGQPVEGGLFDLKMGTIEFDKVCASCGQGPKNCPGHFGYLKLAAPIFHPSYKDIIKKVLETVCFQCSNLLITQHAKEIVRTVKRNKRLDRVRSFIKTKRVCELCDKLQPEIRRQKHLERFTYTFKNIPDAKEEVLTPNLAREILKRITNSDAELLGFSGSCRPEWMIMTILPISPPVMRPTVVTDSNQRGEDDLTVYLSHIIRANRTIQEKINSQNVTEANLITFIETMNLYISMMIVGGVKKTTNKSTMGGRLLATRTGKALKSINDRISGKQGRFRKHLMGKRVDFSARSVITPDPNLDIDQLGMPLKIAKILTFPEVVNDYNKDKIYQYIVNAKTGKYPQAISIKRGETTRTIEYIKEDIVLENGDIVVRQLVDGDIALFNRQPTLHRMSMMAFKIKTMPGKTFRINLSVTTAFNADFDGDCSNCLQQGAAFMVSDATMKGKQCKLRTVMVI